MAKIVVTGKLFPEVLARLEAEAAHERIGPAGALPDPFLRVELENITRGGTQGATLSPSRVGDTKYLLAQPLPLPLLVLAYRFPAEGSLAASRTPARFRLMNTVLPFMGQGRPTSATAA